MTVSLLLHFLAAYVAASATAGLTLGVALGVMIRRAERRHRQHVALLIRTRTLPGVGSGPEQMTSGAAAATRGHG
jgi:hypothetical protein